MAWFMRYSGGTWKSISCGLQGYSAQGPPKVWYKLSGELRFSPSAVKSCPNAKDTRLGSVSAARINVKSPTMPNWSFTILPGMFVTLPSGDVWIPSHTQNHIGNWRHTWDINDFIYFLLTRTLFIGQLWNQGFNFNFITMMAYGWHIT